MARVELRLVCVECGCIDAAGTKGWKAYLGCDELDDPPEVVILCPECAAREFGGAAGLE